MRLESLTVIFCWLYEDAWAFTIRMMDVCPLNWDCVFSSFFKRFGTLKEVGALSARQLSDYSGKVAFIKNVVGICFFFTQKKVLSKIEIYKSVYFHIKLTIEIYKSARKRQI